jgi:hypothetical protein
MRSHHLPSAVVRGSLRDGLLVCLSLLERDPERYEAAAVAWHARWCRELPGVGFAESLAALAALEALAGPDPLAASRSLCAACEHDGLEEPAQVIDAWLARRSLSLASMQASSSR